MKKKFLRFLCCIGIHDLETFEPHWYKDLSPEIRNMHFSYFCRRCNIGK